MWSSFVFVVVAIVLADVIHAAPKRCRFKNWHFDDESPEVDHYYKHNDKINDRIPIRARKEFLRRVFDFQDTNQSSQNTLNENENSQTCIPEHHSCVKMGNESNETPKKCCPGLVCLYGFHCAKSK